MDIFLLFTQIQTECLYICIYNTLLKFKSCNCNIIWRLYLSYQINCVGGICFDQAGKCLKRWFWPDDSKSIVFHPIAFTLNEYMSIQIHSRFKIILHFRTKVGCCRFSIGSKIFVNVKVFFY